MRLRRGWSWWRYCSASVARPVPSQSTTPMARNAGGTTPLPMWATRHARRGFVVHQADGACLLGGFPRLGVDANVTEGERPLKRQRIGPECVEKRAVVGQAEPQFPSVLDELGVQAVQAPTDLLLLLSMVVPRVEGQGQ